MVTTWILYDELKQTISIAWCNWILETKYFHTQILPKTLRHDSASIVDNKDSDSETHNRQAEKAL
jgi:hypothetical protein